MIAQANAIVDEKGHFLEDEIEVRKSQRFEVHVPGGYRLHGRVAEADPEHGDVALSRSWSTMMRRGR